MAGDLDARFARLDQAVTALEAEHGQRHALLEERERLYAEVARLSTDRAQLAHLLDHARAEVRSLQSANETVSRRLVDVMETIRTVLGTDPAGDPAHHGGFERTTPVR